MSGLLTFASLQGDSLERLCLPMFAHTKTHVQRERARERESESESERDRHTHTHTHTHICNYILYDKWTQHLASGFEK